ncbi:MAG: phosphotransferase [Aggregatilineales bacterium]
MTWQQLRDGFDHEHIDPFITRHWNATPGTSMFISAAYNIIYRFQANGAGYYLRICHPILHSIEDANATLAYLRHLAENGAPVNRPVKSVNGMYIERLPDDFYAQVVTEAQGEEIGLDHTDLRVYEAWGESLGKLHRAATSFQPPQGTHYPTVQRFWENVRETALRQDDPLREAFLRVDTWLKTLSTQDDYGLCHGDYRPGNVIWDTENFQAVTVDFDEPNYHWFISDVVRALLEFYDRPLAQRQAYRTAFLRGYCTARELDDTWQAKWVPQMTDFAQMRGLLMHLWTIQENEANGLPTNDAWGRIWAVNRYEW